MSITRPVKHTDPTVSVVIPTVPENRYSIPETLHNQTVDQYEVVVVSDASINRCEARNRGIITAKGDIIAQTDDDCRPPTTWVENIQKAFESNQESVILGGPLDKHPSGPRRYIGANLAYRREKALDVGGFNTALSGWRADTDFGWRMEIEHGAHNSMFDPKLEVEHIGPLRTDVNRELERKFRREHPIRYFTLLHAPDIIFGDKIGYVIGIIHSMFPKLVDTLINLNRKYSIIEYRHSYRE